MILDQHQDQQNFTSRLHFTPFAPLSYGARLLECQSHQSSVAIMGVFMEKKKKKAKNQKVTKEGAPHSLRKMRSDHLFLDVKNTLSELKV